MKSIIIYVQWLLRCTACKWAMFTCMVMGALTLAFALTIPTPFAYFRDTTYLRQVQALLHGQLSLSERLQDYRWDLALMDHGLYQHWGLGIPFLRLPFDVVARIFDYPGFPLVIIMLLLLSLSIVALTYALAHWFRAYSKHPNFYAFLCATSIIIPSAASRAILTSQDVYYQAVFFNAIWAMLILACMMIPRAQVKRWHWYVFVIICGAQVYFRPTGLAYSLGAITIMGGWYWSHLSLRTRLYGGIIFAAMQAILLFLNYHRFNSPFEFGHAFNIPPFLGMATNAKFGLESFTAPIIDEVKELIHTMFFITPEFYGRYLQGTPVEWFSERIKYRLIDFPAFSPWDSIALATGFILALHPRLLPSQLRLIAALFFIIFCTIVVFYIRLNASCSRYMVDIMPIVAFSWLLILFASIKALTHYHKLNKYSFCVLILLFSLHNVDSIMKAFQPPHHPIKKISNSLIKANKTNRVITRLNGHAPDAKKSIRGPQEYTCKARFKNRAQRLRKPAGWRNNCRVKAMTSLLLRSSQCVELTIQPNQSIADQIIEEIRIKSNEVDLLLSKHSAKKGHYKYLTYCTKEPLTDLGFRQIVILWSQGEMLRKRKSPRFRLLKVRAVPANN